MPQQVATHSKRTPGLIKNNIDNDSNKNNLTKKNILYELLPYSLHYNSSMICCWMFSCGFMEFQYAKTKPKNIPYNCPALIAVSLSIYKHNLNIIYEYVPVNILDSSLYCIHYRYFVLVPVRLFVNVLG